MNLVNFNSFIVKKKKKNEVDYFVLFHVKLDTHAQRDVHTKQTHTRALLTRQFFFIIFIDSYIVYLGHRVGTTLQSGFEVIGTLCVCSVITGLTFLALHPCMGQ